MNLVNQLEYETRVKLQLEFQDSRMEMAWETVKRLVVDKIIEKVREQARDNIIDEALELIGEP